ncbi:MAG: deoxyribose-phosphate aldolase [Flavobacteriales bacterium]|nr:deoxyribose-phosphate aldolase [Flavobacteriales bacterium]
MVNSIPISNIKEIPSLSPTFKISDDYSTEINTIISKQIYSLHGTELLNRLLSLLDLTSLEGSDTNQKIETMANKVVGLEKYPQINSVAAICVYPTFAKLVSQHLKSTRVKTACVAGAFPSGQSNLEVKLKEISWAIEQGADEIDMVISRGKLLEGNYQEVFDEIAAIKRCCGDIHLKVIIESGELKNNQNIRIASDLAMYAGADFIKTSTGKISEGATLNSVYVMLNAINDFYSVTNRKIGMKPAGGISDIETAMNYLKLVEQTVGESWINNQLFRFGASRLANNVLNKIATQLNIIELQNYFE